MENVASHILSQLLIAGEEPPEALYQPNPLRELHFTSCSRCSRQRYAKYDYSPT